MAKFELLFGLATMEFSYTTPALLFPTVSLMLLAFFNRFIALAGLIRKMHQTYKEKPDPNMLGQIKNLYMRILLIRNMTALGMASIAMCVGSMFSLYLENRPLAIGLFSVALGVLLFALLLSFWEITISTEALTLELSDIAEDISASPNFRLGKNLWLLRLMAKAKKIRKET